MLSNFRIGNGSTRSQGITEFFRGTASPANRSEISNFNRFTTLAMANTAIFRHQFRKKGRNFAASAGFNINNTDGEADQNSSNVFYNIRPGVDSTFLLNQSNSTLSHRNEIRSSLLFIEPLSRKFYWEMFYNFSYNQAEVEREVYDVRSGEADVRNDNLSRYYTSGVLYNRVGSTVRYSFKGLNIGLGLGVQQLGLNGEFSGARNRPVSGSVDQRYTDWIPNLSVSYNLKNNRYLSVYYNKMVNAPAITQLQPIVDNSNPLYIVEGNPDLMPQVGHNASVNFNYFNPVNFLNMYISVSYRASESQIVYAQQVDDRLVTRSRPVNVSGGDAKTTYMNIGFPVIKTKFTLNLGGNGAISKNPNFINDVENLARSGITDSRHGPISRRPRYSAFTPAPTGASAARPIRSTPARTSPPAPERIPPKPT